MKARRHQRILDIIRVQPIKTQEELADELAREGISVTQATISRDIKELRLIKAPVGDGTYRYTIPADRSIEDINKRVRRIFHEVAISIEDSENIIVIKTLEGAAQAVAAVLDDLAWSEVVGSLAGDDTIFLVIKPAQCAHEVMARLNRFRM
ncbi:MAG: arginine repressor [Firmicutes bacterium]|nr:arginine repressor [Bacillota bacterium]MDD4337742.1 arginine repressor [Bacillota bacterium]MDD4792094.1 arginine repressor [Bacillota bacterium]